MWGGKNSIVILGLSQTLNMSIKKIMENFQISYMLSSFMLHILLWLLLWLISILVNRYIPFIIGKKYRMPPKS